MRKRLRHRLLTAAATLAMGSTAGQFIGCALAGTEAAIESLNPCAVFDCTSEGLFNPCIIFRCPGGTEDPAATP